MSVLSRKVLLLNGDYRALGVIDMVRAVSLVFRGVARIDETDETQVLHTPTSTFLVPSVIHLIRYEDIRKRRRESGKRRFHIFVRDKFRCQYCATKFQPADLTLDHILPSSRGGSDEPENLATSCRRCNQRKGNRTPDEARMPLLATPSALRYGLDQALLQRQAEVYPEWRPYLFLGEKVA